MAKLRNVTASELAKAEDLSFELSQIVADIHNRASQGYAEPIEKPLALATAFASASRSLAELSSYCLVKAALIEQKREIEERLRKRTDT